jgi:hypothetical protein
MRKQARTLFEGWQIILQCTEFRCHSGGRMFASTAVLRYVPIKPDVNALRWRSNARQSILFPEEAFHTRDEANTDSASRARVEITAMNGLGARESDESLGARYEITFDGRQYAFHQYRYDHFGDALRYATSQQAKAGFQRDGAFKPSWAPVYRPSGQDEDAMRLHGIEYANGCFTFSGYRYSRLSDAVAFAAAHPAPG